MSLIPQESNAHPTRPPFVDGLDFPDVFKQEIEEWVSKAAKTRPGPKREIKSKDKPAQENELVGLALSGGGIRSATFALGACQALARYGVLPKIDYLSTVSGGAYFGAAISTLLHWRSQKDSDVPLGEGHPLNQKNFPFAFDPKVDPTDKDNPQATKKELKLWKAESLPVRHLREQSNHLAPRLGLFDVQTWYTVFRVVIYALGMLAMMALPPVLLILSFMNSITGWLTSPIVVALLVKLVALCLVLFVISVAIPAPQHPIVGWFNFPVLLTMLAALVWLFLEIGAREVPALLPNLQGWATLTLGGGGIAGFLAAVRWAFSSLGKLGDAQGALDKAGLKVSLSRLLPQILLGVAGYVVLAGVLLFLYVKLKPGLETLPWSARMLWLLYLTAATFVLLRLSSVVKVMNYLSLHSFYLWRLRDSYIQKEVDARGKVCAGRSADVPLADLQKDNRAQPWGPYHVIGTALNTSGSADIRNLGRKSDAFFLSPFYSGSSTTGFAPTKEHYPTLKVGEAMAISGAAFSPNQGRATNTSLAILMTLFNARLGFWLKNPRLLSGSKENLSRFPPYLLYWIEMFGKASGSDPYVYLSDGGHFDNSGIYELIRRRCRYIIAVDGSGEPSDKEARFGTIGIVSRLVRIDFGVDIQMDLNLMEPDKEKGHTKSHYALGRIVYPKERDDQKEEDREGLLVYLKASLLGDENAPDLEYYDRISPMFPNHSTADQFFDEAQFESYRALGYHIARDAFRETLVGKITEEQEKGPQKEHWLRLDRLCGRWNQDVIGPPVNG